MVVEDSMILNTVTNGTSSITMPPIVRSARLNSFRNISLCLVGIAATSFALQICNIQRATAEAANRPVVQQVELVRQLLETGKCPSCNLGGADLRNAHLIGADLRNANLEGANLTGANLEGADLTGATLKNANLTEVMLSNADLQYSDLTNANLQRSIAYNADTRGATLVNLNLADAKIWNSGISVGGDEPIK
jgi:uncharacterized protein YjbI with pentapeptide repeats